MSRRYSDDEDDYKGYYKSKRTNRYRSRSRSRSRTRSHTSRSTSRSSSRSTSHSRTRSRSRSPVSKYTSESNKRYNKRSNYENKSSRLTSSGSSSNSNRRDNIGHSYKSYKESNKYEHKGNESDDIDEMVPPPAPIISKVSLSIGKPGSVAKITPVQMKLSAVKAAEPAKKIAVASVFNNDSDDDVEEMPPECRMRMRNIGRDTPTSSGPNSFGKTKQGFCDAKKIFEKHLRDFNND